MDGTDLAGTSGVVRRAELVARGYTSEEIDRWRRSGRLVTVRRGTYRCGGGTPPTPEAAHALAARAAAADLSDDAVLAFGTAAVLLGIPLWGVSLRTVHVVRDRPGGGRVQPGLHVHPAPLPDSDVVEVDGLRVTSAARTVADLGRTLEVRRAVVVADGALHLAADPRTRHLPGAAQRDAVTGVLHRQARRHGRAAAERALAMADDRSASPGETCSRLAMVGPIPPPVLQWPVPGTTFLTDFAWPSLGVVGEFDGRRKYERDLRPGETPADAVWREKRREDAIRATGLTVVRWAWSDIDDPGPTGMTALLRRALTR